jgi:hypothetical protein
LRAAAGLQTLPANMRNIFIGATFAFLVGCGGGGGKACEELKTKACDGLDAAACGKWFDEYIRKGPSKDEKLSDEQANVGCKMVLDEPKAVEGYKNRAKREFEKKEDKKADKPEKKDKPADSGW